MGVTRRNCEDLCRQKLELHSIRYGSEGLSVATMRTACALPAKRPLVHVADAPVIVHFLADSLAVPTDNAD